MGYLGPLASQYPHSIIAYTVANYSPHINHFRLLRACSIDRVSEQEYYKNKVKKSLVLAFITLAISRNLLHIKYFNICRVGYIIPSHNFHLGNREPCKRKVAVSVCPKPLVFIYIFFTFFRTFCLTDL